MPSDTSDKIWKKAGESLAPASRNYGFEINDSNNDQ